MKTVKRSGVRGIQIKLGQRKGGLGTDKESIKKTGWKLL